MDTELFTRLVEEAIDSLPEEFKTILNNVAVVVEPAPTREQMIKLRMRHGLLFGLYEGVPQTNRGRGYTMVLPDKITIFQRPIEAVCHTEEEIKEQVRKTVLHEIGHHFGMSEKKLRKLRM